MVTTRLSHYLSKTILVGLRDLTTELSPVPFKLIGIEDCGLWLQETDPSQRFALHVASQPESELRTLLIPYSQITYLMLDGLSVGLGPNGNSHKKAKRPEVPHPPNPQPPAKRRGRRM